MLNRVEKIHSNPDVSRRRPLYAAMHDLAVERFPEGVDAFLPFNLRARSKLLRAGDYDALEALQDYESAMKAQARAVAVRPADGAAEVELEGELTGLRFARDGDRLLWSQGPGADAVDATDALSGATIQLLLKRRATHEEYRVPAKVEPRFVDGPDGVRVVVAATGTVTAATGAAGGSLPPALWEVHAVVIVAGFRAITRVRRRDSAEHLMLAVTADGRVQERRPGWQRNLRRRVPRPVVRAIREVQRVVRRRTRG
jgi:hypothetical protein